MNGVHVFDTEAVERELWKNVSIFRSYIDEANRWLSEPATAAVYSQIAANFACRNHCGLFVSRRLEALLLRLGRGKVPAGRGAIRDGRRPIEHILHVATVVTAVGGHARLLARWLRSDTDRKHSIVLTRQGLAPIPSYIETAVCAAKGMVHRLDDHPGGLLSRASALRRLACDVDAVVLHVYPYDVVPLLAFGIRDGLPPIFLVNHADHLFWTGVSIADAVAHIRRGSVAVSLHRRGISRERCFVLPIPLPAPRRQLPRPAAKRKVGVPENGILLLSVGAPYKYESTNGTRFSNALLPVLFREPRAHLFVVGPSSSGQWEAARELTGGRVTAMGVVEDPTLFYEAADVYVDSFPVGSLTSMLEAGSYGAPIVRYHGYGEGAALFHSDDVALEDVIVTVADVTSLEQQLVALTADESRRVELGKRTQKNIADVHLAPGWQHLVERLYALGRQLPPVSQPDSPSEDVVRTDELDAALLWQQKTTGFSCREEVILHEHLRLLPFRHRLRIWRNISTDQRRFFRGYLIPEAIGIRNERWLRQWAARIGTDRC